MGPRAGAPLSTQADLRARLDAGVAAGVISPAQRDALLELGSSAPATRAHGEMPNATAVPSDALPDDDARRALDGVTVAYWVGAALVVFAFGWFLADRWELLGPAGVLAVVTGYAVLFAGTSRKLASEGFPLAAGVALALATTTVPVAAWAVLRLTGEWPGPPWSEPLHRYEPYAGTRRLVVALSGLLAGLVAVRLTDGVRPAIMSTPNVRRRVRRTPVAIPIAVATGFSLVQLAQIVAVVVAGDDVYYLMHGWAAAAAGGALFGIAYETDRRQPLPNDPRREDFAGWLYVAACVVWEIGIVEAFDSAGAGRHTLPLVALAQLAAAVRLRRRTLLAAGMGNVIWYLGYLAFDVFEDVLSFPLLLATFGAAVVVLAVIVQRRFPALVRPNAERLVGRATLPGGSLVAWAPAALAALLLAVAIPAAHRRAAALDREAIEGWRRVRAERQRGQP